MIVSFTDVSLTQMTGITQKIIVLCDDIKQQNKVYNMAKANPDNTRVYRSVRASKLKRHKDYEFTELTAEEFFNQC